MAGSDELRRVEEALEQAELLRRRKRYNDGISLLVDALELGVKADAVYFRLGNIYYDAGDLGRAELAWRRAVAANPGHVNAHYNLAALYKKTGRLAESSRMQRRAVRLEGSGRGRSAGRGADRPVLPPEPPEWAEANLREPVPEEFEEPEAAVPLDPPQAPLSEPDLNDDPRFRAWARNVALVGLLFSAVAVAVLLFIILLVAAYLI